MIFTISASVSVHTADLKLPVRPNEPPVRLQPCYDIMRAQTTPTRQSHLVLESSCMLKGKVGVERGGATPVAVFSPAAASERGWGHTAASRLREGQREGGGREGCW